MIKKLTHLNFKLCYKRVLSSFLMVKSAYLIKELPLSSKRDNYLARGLNPDDLINMVRICLIQALVFIIVIRNPEL